MRRFLPGVVAALGFALVLAGVVVFELADQSPADFGWSAYMPLPSDAVSPSPFAYTFSDGWAVFWSGQQVLGALLVVVGLLVLTAVGSWLLGRRTTARF